MIKIRRIIIIGLITVIVCSLFFTFIFRGLSNRITTHDWSEGKAIAGTIANMLKSYAEPKGHEGLTRYNKVTLDQNGIITEYPNKPKE